VLNSIETEAVDAKLRASAEAEKEEPSKDETASKETEVKEEKKPEGNVYTVQWRKKNTDCLWRIAQKVYKDAAYWPAIYIANRDQIKDPDLIFPGQKFIIPPNPQKKPSYKKIVEEEKAKELEKEKAVSEEKSADKESKDASGTK
jgi:nucleoid-associated protein YgaU